MSNLGPPSIGVLALLLTALTVVGCAVPVASGLDDAQADRIVVVLDQAGVAADKESDPATEGRYRVTVQRDDAPHAIAAIEQESLPTPFAPGLLDAFGKGWMVRVPSELAEHAQYTAGLAGELERSLRGIDGVLSARVHLSIPPAEPFADGPRPRASASVLIKHRGATPPIDRDQVKQLVSGAAAGLAPADVAVVLLAHPAPPATGDRELARLGPLAMTRRSLGFARIGIGVIVLLDVILVAVVLRLWTRLRRLHDAHDESSTAGRPA